MLKGDNLRREFPAPRPPFTDSSTHVSGARGLCIGFHCSFYFLTHFTLCCHDDRHRKSRVRQNLPLSVVARSRLLCWRGTETRVRAPARLKMAPLERRRSKLPMWLHAVNGLPRRASVIPAASHTSVSRLRPTPAGPQISPQNSYPMILPWNLSSLLTS